MTEIEIKRLAQAQEDLIADFPAQAYSQDNSRGFPLTSVKAAYVFERLNQIFGLCGYGWRYAHSEIITWGASKQDELVVEVALQYRIADGLVAEFSPPVVWDNVAKQWTTVGEQPTVWSEPVFAFGGKMIFGKGSAPVTDSHKSAVTDGLTKAAAMIGVAQSVFKGHFNIEALETQPANIPARPMPPEVLKAHLGEMAQEGNRNPASEGQRKYVVGLLQKCVQGLDDEAGPDLLEFLWNERGGEPLRSSRQLSSAQAGAMINGWLLDKENNNVLHSAAPDEAKAAIGAFRAKS